LVLGGKKDELGVLRGGNVVAKKKVRCVRKKRDGIRGNIQERKEGEGNPEKNQCDKSRGQKRTKKWTLIEVRN